MRLPWFQFNLLLNKVRIRCTTDPLCVYCFVWVQVTREFKREKQTESEMVNETKQNKNEKKDTQKITMTCLQQRKIKKSVFLTF